MHTTAMGLVVKEVKVGEADRLLTILTDRFGTVQASARGSRRLKSPLFSATGLFCYAEFTFFTQKGRYIVDEAQLHSNFFDLRNSVEGLAVASYIVELLTLLQPHRPEEAQELLRLALNSLYLLAQGKVDPRLVRAVCELRAVSEAGYRPDLVACTVCSRFEHPEGFWFDCVNGRLYCAHCAQSVCHDADMPMAAVTAMRHAVYAEPKKVFSFSLAPAPLAIFTRKTEEYLRVQLDSMPKTLDFVHTVLP